MVMKVVLCEYDVRLGDTGDVVNVANGFARNFLFPQGKAREATPQNVKSIQNELCGKRTKLEKEQKEKEALAIKIKDLVLTFSMETSSSGHLFGTITHEMVAAKIEELSGVHIDKKKVALSEHIKTAGKYKAKIKFFSKVMVELPVLVSELRESAADEAETATKRRQRRPRQIGNAPEMDV